MSNMKPWVGARQRVEHEIAAFKEIVATPQPGDQKPADWNEFTPGQRLYSLMMFVDWSGISDKDVVAILGREVDPSGLTKSDVAWVTDMLERHRTDPEFRMMIEFNKGRVMLEYDMRQTAKDRGIERDTGKG